MKWTGLTGGIATGKSSAAKLIEGLGFPVIDADLIAHKLSEPGQKAYEQILSQFGQEVLLEQSEIIDRRKLGSLIFASQNKKNQLEAILHPLIQKEVQQQKAMHEEKGEKLCFYDVPLLFEKKMQSQFETTILIWCDPLTQLDRLMRRNSLSEADALLRMKNQMSLVEKVKLADFCIDNSGDIPDLEKQIRKLCTTLV